MDSKSDIQLPLLAKGIGVAQNPKKMLGINEDNMPGYHPEPPNEGDGHQKIELFLSCRNLVNRDVLSLSDPQIILYILDKDGKPRKIGTTEMIKDNLNPDFTKTFKLFYIFELVQRLRFEIRDIDDDKGAFDPLGVVDTTIGDIMGSKSQVSIHDVKLDGKNAGKLIIRTEIISGGQVIVNMKLNGDHLYSPNGCCASGARFRISRPTGDSSMVKVYESEPINGTKNPDWTGFSLDFQTFCNRDMQRPVTIEVIESNCLFFHPGFIGEATFSLKEIQDQNIRELKLKNQKNKNADVGKLLLRSFYIQERPTFLEYLRGGVQLSVILAIDFTGSNGDPRTPSSLHAIKEDSYNDYQQAIHSVCEILLCYDYDKKVKMYGFGGIPAGKSEVSHCFPLDGEGNDGDGIEGLDGIMAAYQNALMGVTLNGPTYFSGIIKKAAEISRNEKSCGSQVYTIQLIITDGIIGDMSETIDHIVDAADLPLSIVIVGVGNADFGNMDALDSDDKKLVSTRGYVASRDIVQFVPFDKFKSNKEKLAEEVLEEIPTQLLEYMTQNRIEPRERRPVNLNI